MNNERAEVFFVINLKRSRFSSIDYRESDLIPLVSFNLTDSLLRQGDPHK